MAPGVLIVWSGNAPRYDAHVIPPGGLVLGRDLIADERISQRHARVDFVHHRIAITELGSRNGTRVFGEGDVAGQLIVQTLPAVVGLGNTLALIVADIEPYQRAVPAVHGSVGFAASLAPAHAAMTEAALAGDHVAVVGPRHAAVALAGIYGSAFGGQTLHYRPRIALASELRRIGTLRTLVLDLDELRLEADDVATILELLETDVRIVTCVHAPIDLRAFPKELAPALCARMIGIPDQRYDELPTTLDAMFKELVPRTARMRASAVAHVFVASRLVAEGRLIDRFRNSVIAWERRGEDELGGSHIENDLYNRHPEAFCRIAGITG